VYSAKFVSDEGYTYNFGVDGKTVFDMDIGNGVSVDINTSQGFSQIGENIEAQTISGRLINVKGVLYSDIAKNKRLLRSAFAPFTSGRLTFNNGYYIDVTVKDTPTFSPIKDDGRFTMLLYAPFPFFCKSDTGVLEVGKMIASFHFPTNYAAPHVFGKKDRNYAKNLNNEGDVEIPFGVVFKTDAKVENISVTNKDTGEFLKINSTLFKGQEIRVKRNAQGVLNVVLVDGSKKTNIIDTVDENSTLLSLKRGVNHLSVTDSYSKGVNLIANFTYNMAVTSIYED
jgi:hypothetical protein